MQPKKRERGRQSKEPRRAQKTAGRGYCEWSQRLGRLMRGKVGKVALPKLTPCEIGGCAGYWRAEYANGLVHVVKGSRAEAEAAVRKVLQRAAAREAWFKSKSTKLSLRLL